jgi:hypothetical protein
MNLKISFYIFNISIINYDIENFDDVDWEIINNGRNCEENKKILEGLIRENDIYNVKPFKEILSVVKNQLYRAKKNYYSINLRELNKNEKDFRKRRDSDFDNVYKNFLSQKRKNSN